MNLKHTCHVSDGCQCSDHDLIIGDNFGKRMKNVVNSSSH